MRVALFCHSLLSDWNHGSAQFLRGVVTELLARRHDVCVYEPREDHGEKAIDLARHVYPRIRPKRYDLATIDLEAALDDVDLVLVHDGNDPELVRRIGERRERPGTRFKALFHDTHHRSITDEAAMAEYQLGGYDGVLACSAAVRDAYQRRSWAKRAWTWHEAADPRVFFPVPPPPSGRDGDVVSIGNRGDGDRREEVGEVFVDPVRDVASPAITYAGWVPSFQVPEVYARFKCTMHVPKEPFVPGVPDTRVFEALSCAIPLVCSPWDDTEGLFTAGRDYLVVQDGADMRRHLQLLVNDAHARSELSRHGRATILARHTCAHRVDELIALAGDLGVRVRRPILAAEATP